ncbi:hypothetical protein CLIB1444_02S00650 [[Candida] jaroonii]|uniref:Uncharacterized protein n=1 Tax=[Candida] jaroonii TaxID=467808 RepID=A0ACA9Y2B7_9ASCO|nr:hypothetical protein CLIB1444_02S00650 [[Candida] jaroonii]
MVQNKRNLKLSPISDEDFEPPSLVKRTPVSANSWKGVSNEQMELEKSMITLINSEVSYFQTILSSITVYKSLLENTDGFAKIFSLSEKNLIFDDLTNLITTSRFFLIEILRQLLKTPILPHKLDLDTISNEKLTSFNIPHLIYNCDVHRFNVGSIVKSKIFDNKLFKKSIENLSMKYGFIISIIEERSKSESGVDKWLMIGKRINKLPLSTLLIKPLKRLVEYPPQLKRIMDIVDDQYDLNLSLVKVNKLINNCHDLPKIQSWDQLRDYNKHTVTKFNNNLEYCVDDIDEYNIGASTKPVSHNLNRHITEFEIKHRSLQQLEKVFIQYSSKISVFVHEQTKYSHLWLNVLSGEMYIESIIDKYREKMKSLSVFVDNFKLLFEREVHQPLIVGLKLTRDCARLIKRLNSKNSDKEKVVRDLSCRLPRLIPLLNELCDELLYKFNHLNCRWMKAFIGETKIKEFNELRNSVHDNNDIVTFYHRQFTKSI